MAIIRSPRPQSNFYMLDKRISEDKRLSWAARGMLVFLLGKPDYWEVSVLNLINETEGSLRNGGQTKRDGVKAVLAELAGAGYLTRSAKPRHKAEDGSFAGYDYLVREIPSDSPSPDYPSTADPDMVEPSPSQPSTAEPSTAHPHQVSIESNQRLKKAVKTEVAPPALPEASGEKSGTPKSLTGEKQPMPTAETWKAYAGAYQVRYGVPPVRNATVNGRLANFVKRLGATEAPAVAAWFVLHNAAWYVRGGHSISTMLKDAEKLRTEWARNKQITATEATQVDKTQTNFNAFAPMIAAAKQREAEEAARAGASGHA